MPKGLFLTTFITVLLAEIGDKTQLVAMGAAIKSGALWTVFIAASLALVCAMGLSVLLGGAVTKILPPAALRYGSGALFLGAGFWVIFKG
jgi:putative Ca2+/H+ antiporter (TMEM165/GDT1 family)